MDTYRDSVRSAVIIGLVATVAGVLFAPADRQPSLLAAGLAVTAFAALIAYVVAEWRSRRADPN